MKNRKVEKLIEKLARQCIKLKEPIHIVAICFGGQKVGKGIFKYFKKQGIKASYDEIWTNVVKGKSTVWKSSFSKDRYKGTVLIAEDVIWKGTHVGATKRMLRKMRNKKVYVAVLLDLRRKADFAVFR